MSLTQQEKTDRIRSLNDNLRRQNEGGQILITQGVQNLGQSDIQRILNEVKTYDQFCKDNDPYGEHDFGSLNIGSHKVFWKIDYYDLTLDHLSSDPSDAKCTRRVLTIMLAEEY